MNSHKINNILGYSGLIPFYTFSLLTIFESYTFFLDIFFLYSVIILCFLSGSLWMKLITLPKQKENLLFKFVSVSFPLIAMISELFVTYLLKIIIYILIYILIYICDQKTTNNHLPEYMRLRLILTANVIISHLILIYAIFTYGIL